MSLLTNKKATATTPQVVTLIVDDSNSMRGVADGRRSKAAIAAESIKDIIVTTQAKNQGSNGYRFLLNVAKFGDAVTAVAEAQPPNEVRLDKLEFSGRSGNTNMALALEWGVAALTGALARCRAIVGYDESKTPPPLVIFLSDGENTGAAVEASATKLRSIVFQDGKVNVVACGIGMKPEHFAVMQAVASNEELAINIAPSELAEFLAAVGATMEKPNIDHMGRFREREGAEQARRTAPPNPVPSPSPPVPPPTPPRVEPVAPVAPGAWQTHQAASPAQPGLWAKFKAFTEGFGKK